MVQAQFEVGTKVNLVFFGQGIEKQPGTVVKLIHSGFGRIVVESESGYRYTFMENGKMYVHGLIAAEIELV